MALTLGTKPENLKLLLNPGADFLVTLRPKESTWPLNVRLELVVGEMGPWVATVAPDGSTASWVVDQAQVDAALAQPDLTARLWYIVPGPSPAEEIRLLLARGVAVASG